MILRVWGGVVFSPVAGGCSARLETASAAQTAATCGHEAGGQRRHDVHKNTRTSYEMKLKLVYKCSTHKRYTHHCSSLLSQTPLSYPPLWEQVNHSHYPLYSMVLALYPGPFKEGKEWAWVVSLNKPPRKFHLSPRFMSTLPSSM